MDALIFTAGVGERGPIIREKVTRDLENMGIKVDKEKNWASMTRYAETEISAPDSKVKVFVIPTDEELVMTEDTYALLENSYKDHRGVHLLLPESRLRQQIAAGIPEEGPRQASGTGQDYRQTEEVDSSSWHC